MPKPFQFKQFTIQQDKCAMQIGTDGVLLGAWVSLQHNPESILDMGSGTGVIALQMAQRSSAQIIDAIEIDDEAYEQCTENFENSIWGDRLFCYHASVQEFAEEIEDTYECIISNPPFFAEDYKTNSQARNRARFSDSLPFNHLIRCAARLLSKNGRFSVIIPKKEEKQFIILAAQQGLYPSRICAVRGTPTSEVVRSLLEFTFKRLEPEITSLTIEISRHNYTAAYIDLVCDFYLKM